MILFSYLLYYLVIIPISLLPFPLLYLLSDFLFFIFYSLLGYRKKIVVGNISNSFPEKSKQEINEITQLFYRHFCDVIVESLKSFTISDAQISKRMILKNPELLNNYYYNVCCRIETRVATKRISQNPKPWTSTNAVQKPLD